MSRDWKRLHHRSLQQSKPKLLRELSDRGRLQTHLQEVAQEAQEMFERISDQLRKANPKSTPDQIERSAEEMVLQEIVLVKDEETELAEVHGYLD
ncbi:MAG: TnpV protein [Gemmatimonadetes bacterium]|nr:TnpV protein [Gemmatimonadota bacterium]